MNVVVVLTDQHNAGFLGCAGAPTRTPVLDALAARGTRFDCAYATSPFCAPSRASMITGRYVHETGNWDNATPYNGGVPGWGRYFHSCGVDFTVIGKVDFEEVPGRDYGIGREANVKFRETFDVLGLYPEGRITPRYRNLESHWTVYPRETGTPSNKDSGRVEDAVRWLHERRPSDGPWVLNLHLSKPHPRWAPLRESFDYYLPRVRLETRHRQVYHDLHPAEQAHSDHTCGYLRTDADIVPMHAAYHATVEEVDEDVGQIVNALDTLSLRDDTLIIYSSDHGEMLRAHGALGKMSLYEDSARVPLIIQGPGVPEGEVCQTPVSLLDLYPTVAQAVGIPVAPFARGQSLLAMEAERPDFAFSESHANGRITGSFMIRTKEWKLIENVGYEPILFNLAEDPQEMDDLGPKAPASKAIERILNEMRRRLYLICSPEAVTARANLEQKVRREHLEKTGRLYEELAKRFCLPNPERLLLDPKAVQERYGITIT